MQKVQEAMQTYIQGLGKQGWEILRLITELVENATISLPKSIQNPPKMVTKWSQEGQEIQPSSLRQPGRPQEADLLAIPDNVGANLESKIQQRM